LFVAALAFSLPASADDGHGRQTRARGTCTASSRSRISIESEEGRMRIEFQLDAARPADRWNVVIVRERRIVFRGVLRTDGRHSARLRRTLPDWPGVEAVVVRATARSGETCRASVIV